MFRNGGAVQQPPGVRPGQAEPAKVKIQRKGYGKGDETPGRGQAQGADNKRRHRRTFDELSREIQCDVGVCGQYNTERRRFTHVMLATFGTASSTARAGALASNRMFCCSRAGGGTRRCMRCGTTSG
jgi:hypothetical protein